MFWWHINIHSRSASKRTQDTGSDRSKQKEIENLEKYEVFEEVKYEGQETVGSRWVITKKEKADGQKKNVKGRLVANDFKKQKLHNMMHQQCWESQ